MKPSTPFSLSTLLLLAAIMATLAAFGGFEAQASKPLSASKSSSPLKTSHTSTTAASGRIERRPADDLSAAASSLTNSGNSPLNSDAAADDEVSSLSSSSRERTRKISGSLGDTTKESALEPRGLESNIANAKIKLSTSDMATAAGHHHGKSAGKYYMYAEVPKKKSYKMGFKRGNGKHVIERKESAHKSHVSSYFKWHDKKGKGSHKFEFKHEGKGKKGHY